MKTEKTHCVACDPLRYFLDYLSAMNNEPNITTTPYHQIRGHQIGVQQFILGHKRFAPMSHTGVFPSQMCTVTTRHLYTVF